MRVITQQITFCSDSAPLNDKEVLARVLDRITENTGLTKVNEVTHAFDPQGFSIVHILAESHIALHSWPEQKYAYITLSSCSNVLLDEESCISIIEQILPITDLRIDTIDKEVNYASN